MKTSKVIFSLFIGVAILTAQVGSVLAAPAHQEGNQFVEVSDLACGTDGTNVVITYFNENSDPQEQEVEISLAIAITLGFLPEGTETCDETLLSGIGEEVNHTELMSGEEEAKHPVGAALASFFDFAGYDTIMEAHEKGTGFGVIAQALWITSQLEGDADTFLAIVQAKKDGDFSGLTDYFEEDQIPTNWGQFKKVLQAKNKDGKNNLGVVLSDKDNTKDKTNNGKGQEKDKTNNGKGQDKDKDKNKD